MMDDEELRNYFISILTKGSKSNTYKFALARFLLEYSDKQDLGSIKNKINNNEKEIVSFSKIAEKFLKYYWHQECKYRIRQNYDPNNHPSVVKVIREVFGEKYIPGYFSSMPREKKENAEEKIRERVFGMGYRSQVVPRFQKLKGQPDRHPFYEWDISSGHLEIKPEALSFFHRNYTILTKAVFFEWSKFLEKINTLPRLIAKVQSEEVRRRSLTSYQSVFQDQTDCFYCNRELDERQTHVDHFIPWSYIFEDEPWNLVLACQQCNLRKSDSLAGLNFRNNLINRNRDYQKEIPELRKSLLSLDADNNWVPVIKHHYNNCKEYGFTVRDLP